MFVEVPEVERRQNHISQVDSNHSLLPIALDCLKDEGDERPSVHQLCERVADLKGMPKYMDSARTMQDKDEVIQSQAIRIIESEHTISSKEEEIQQLRQQLQQERDQVSTERQLNQQLRELQQESDQALRENRTQLEEKERQLGYVNQQFRQLQLENDQQMKEKAKQIEERDRQFGRVNQQLEASEQVVAQFERRIAELEQQLSQREQQNVQASSRGKELTSFKLRWKEGKRAPCGMHRCCDAVIDGNTVYIRNEGRVSIYAYHATSDSWYQLPDCDCGSGSITVINGWLTTVGGGSILTCTYSDELFSLTGEGSGSFWTKKFPPMPTKRKWTSALCYESALIVAGGVGEGGKVLSTVEVMNTENLQWSAADDLPEPMCLASATVCGDQLYMLGGMNKDTAYTKSAYICSVNTLLRHCAPSSRDVRFKGVSLVGKINTWRQVADLLVIRSTCESFHGRLLAIGGRRDSGKSTTTVHMYNSTTNSWEIISHMTTGRFQCFTAVLPNNQLMVMGGWTDNGWSDTVEVASVCA